jgi:hypothetical protein
MADIERQYEFIQTNWCNDGDAVHVGHDRDPFVGRAPGDHKFTIPGATPRFVHPLPDLVTTRGGEYLWVPSMAALRVLADGAWASKAPSASSSRAAETAGTALGLALSPLAAAIAFVRGKRVVHPVGAAFRAEVVIAEPPHPLLDGTGLARPGTHPAVARLSRGFDMPLRWPDVQGLAVRILDADGAGRPQDLLVATAKRKRSGRDATTTTRRYEHLFSTMLHFRGPHGELVIRAEPVQPMPDDATVHAGVAGRWQFELSAGAPGAEAHPFARVVLGSPLSRAETEALRFNPANVGGGIEGAGTLNAARNVVYRASQAGRGLRGRLAG